MVDLAPGESKEFYYECNNLDYNQEVRFYALYKKTSDDKSEMFTNNALAGIAINGEDTGISEVRANKAAADNKVYNLAGQQVGKDYKGLIIKNGKKFINK